MFSITLICVGKLKEKFYLSASEEYAKRLRGYVDFSLIELPETRLPDDPSPAQIAQGLAKEAELIRAKLSSEELAAALASVKGSGKSSACFLIGSSFGMDPSLKTMADKKLSMSKMTFPHHLARVMALEQLYRAESIQAGTKYHK